LITRENISDHIDRVFDKIAAAVSFKSRIPEAIDECLRIVSVARDEQPAFTELGRIIGHRQRSHDVVLRKNAWILQHAMSSRAYCVGNYIAFRRRMRKMSRHEFESPLLDQLALAGLVTQDSDLTRIHSRIEKSHALKKIGGMCVDAATNTIYVMHGVSYAQAKRLRPAISAQKGRPGQTLPLFGQFDDRPVSGAAIHVSMALGLQYAAELIRKAVPGFGVRAVAVLSADPGAGWEHQIHDLTEFQHQKGGARLVELDDFPLIRSSLAMRRDDVRLLEQVPASMTTRDVLQLAPVDRATRAFMILSVLWARQQSRQGELASMSVKELAAEIRNRFGVAYSRDLRRHDLEDCLLKHSYIDGPLYRPGEYAITHRGVGRLCLFLASTGASLQFSPDISLEQNVVAQIMQQSARWDEYCFGNSKGVR
jgi:hypothetical protein